MFKYGKKAGYMGIALLVLAVIPLVVAACVIPNIGPEVATKFNAAGEVTGMSVISHAETSGLGSKATDPNWQNQFVGSTEDVSVTKDGGTINAITGATITSRGVCEAVNSAIAVAESMG